jgi:hypothetical protein
VSPAQEHRCGAAAKRPTSPISATKTPGQHRAHPRDGLDGEVACVAGQGGGDLPPQHGDLLVVGDQQPPQRGDPQPIGASKVQLVQQPGAGHPEQVAPRHPNALRGEHGVDLGL